MTKLRRLNLYLGSLLPPSDPRTGEVSLSIHHLSIDRVSISGDLDPTYLPLVRSLHLTIPRASLLDPLRLLLRQITSVAVYSPTPMRHIDTLIISATAIKSICLHEYNIPHLSVDSQCAVMERIEQLRITMQRANAGSLNIIAIIQGSQKLSTVILDGRYLRAEDERGDELLRIVGEVKRECKRQRIGFCVDCFGDTVCNILTC